MTDRKRYADTEYRSIRLKRRCRDSRRRIQKPKLPSLNTPKSRRCVPQTNSARSISYKKRNPIAAATTSRCIRKILRSEYCIYTGRKLVFEPTTDMYKPQIAPVNLEKQLEEKACSKYTSSATQCNMDADFTSTTFRKADPLHSAVNEGKIIQPEPQKKSIAPILCRKFEGHNEGFNWLIIFRPIVHWIWDFFSVND